MKCLLVDDHSLIASHHPGVDLRHAGCLGDAITLLAAESELRFVLPDLALPDSSGVATLQHMRGAARLGLKLRER